MVKTRIDEALGIVDFLVQTNDIRHITLTKIGEVGFRCVQRVTLAEETCHVIQLILTIRKCLTFSILLFACGPEKANSFRGTIQFKSPFSTF